MAYPYNWILFDNIKEGIPDVFYNNDEYGNIMPSEGSQSEGTTWFHLSKMSECGKAIWMERILAIAWACGGRGLGEDEYEEWGLFLQ